MMPPQGTQGMPGTGTMPPLGMPGTGTMPPQGMPGTGTMPPQGTGAWGGGPWNPQGSGPWAAQPAEQQPPARFGYQMQEGGRPRMPRWQLFLIIAVIAATGIYAWLSFRPDQANYAIISTFTLGEHHTGEALIVRNEVPYDAEGVTNIVYTAAEGSKVGRNTQICQVFSSGYSTREMTALQDYRDQIRDYQRTLLSSETTYDARMARVESDVLSRSKEVRGIIAGAKGNLTNQERLLSAAIEARQQYLKQKYSSDQRLSRLYDDEQAQMQKIDSWTKTYTSQWEAFVSTYSDGYEYGLTTDNYESFRPQQVRRMVNGEKPASNVSLKGRTTIYRLVNDSAWMVLLLADDSAWNPVKGQSYTLRFGDDPDRSYSAAVESFEHSGGELLVRLRVENSVETVLSMRVSSAELYDEATSLMVPPRAIYHQDGMEGVVIVDGSTQSFVPVNVTRRDNESVCIQPINQGLLYEGMVVRLF